MRVAGVSVYAYVEFGRSGDGKVRGELYERRHSSAERLGSYLIFFLATMFEQGNSNVSKVREK